MRNTFNNNDIKILCRNIERYNNRDFYNGNFVMGVSSKGGWLLKD
jgi:hypothetical protein